MKMIEKRMEQRGQGGFTLIELLVVIAILAVLGGAVIIGIGAMRENAQKQVCKTEKETIELAAEAYALEHEVSVGDVTIANLTDGDEPYLKKINEGEVDDWTLNNGVATPTENGKHEAVADDCS